MCRLHPGVVDGNMYHGKGPVQVSWKHADGKQAYTLSQAQGMAAYQRDTGQDVRSRVAEVAFADASAGDFHPAPGSAAIDAGQPLSRTTNAGAGAVILVGDVSFFTAGLKTRAGKVWMPADEIMVANSRARIIALDRRANTLTLDRPLRWQKGEPVGYAYAGKGPDVGALESGFPESPNPP